MNTSRLFILLGTIFIVPGCLIIDDEELNEPCNADCTTIQGKFTTEDGKSIKNLTLALNWEVYGQLGVAGVIRKIMTGKTDDNGDYKFVFYAKDKELRDGSYTIKFKLLDNSYITFESDDYYKFYSVNKRDTTIIGNYHIPKKGAKITLKITNPENITGDDLLSSSVSYKFDLNQYMSYVPGELYSPNASQTTIETAANQYTYIRTTKRKNSESITTVDSVVIAVDETRLYEIEF